ncbi:GNAT family N-acetyltransferase [Tissierella sp. Yu-01]|uniref:GNAT family N-acetyltransferase n=1 Tax=Tissierella sp. Yu-01 TaxID=3035694 RepID=UPI00240CE961|nr:GNAT family N-acetyltransferase [Tissierella sp. Yu-01]WFA09310.1 GNAT family N-acetyltransferase [Tissierella sp. Yu-01]
MLDQISIRIINAEEVPVAQEFLFRMVKDLYNFDRHPVYHKDIINMEEIYINKKRNSIMGAFTQDGSLIGTIAVKQFDNRFMVLKGMYRGELTAEVGRCYLNEDYRKKGLGSLLLDNLIKFCRENGYEKLYLHTHKHLPGGFDFWRKKGFIVTVEEDNIEKNVHMEREIPQY